MIQFRDLNNLNIISTLLEIKLEEGLRTHELVDVSYLRGIGKSYALSRFAKKHNLPIISSSGDAKRYIWNSNSYLMSQDVLIDEGVDAKMLKDNHINVVTGFYANY